MSPSKFSVFVFAALVSTAIYSFYTRKTKGDDEEQQSHPQKPAPSRTQPTFTPDDHRHNHYAYSSYSPTTHTPNSHLIPSSSTHSYAQASHQPEKPRIEPRTAQATANTKESPGLSHHVHRHGLASSRSVSTSAAQAQIPHLTNSTASFVHQTISTTTSDHPDPLLRTSLTSSDARDSRLTPSNPASTHTPYAAKQISALVAQTTARTPPRTDYDNSLHRSDVSPSSSVWESYQTTPTPTPSTPTRTHALYSTQQSSTGVVETTIRTSTLADYDDIMKQSPYSYLRTPSPDTSRPRVSRLTVSRQKHSRTQSSSSDSDYLDPASRSRAVPRSGSLDVDDAIADAQNRTKAVELRDQARRSARDMREARDRAKIAHRKGDQEAENEYRQEARAHESAKKNLDKRAAKILFKVNNKAHEEGTIDLHDLYVVEAVEYAKEELQSAIYRDDDTVTFIVGQGRHSKGGVPKLRPALEELFDELRHRYSLDPENAGKLIVYLN